MFSCSRGQYRLSNAPVNHNAAMAGGGHGENARTQFIGVFLDLQLKATNSEISTKPLDLRGLLAAMKIVETGLSPRKAVTMGVVNKTFDIFEKEIVEDIVKTRIPADWTRDDVYER